MRKILHFFDRKRLLQRKWLRFQALEKTHLVFRHYAELIDILVSGKRVAGSIKALLKVSVQNTELNDFGFVVRRQRGQAEPRHPLEQLYDMLRHEGQWLRVAPGDSESTIRSAVNGVLDGRSYGVHLHPGPAFPPEWPAVRILDGILHSELAPAGFALCRLEASEGGFYGTILPAGKEQRVAGLLEQIRNS